MGDKRTHTVRRSVALPQELVEQALAAAAADAAGNLNRVVVESLREYVARRKARAFESAMEEMAADPGIRRECAAIGAEFARAELDGLRDD